MHCTRVLPDDLLSSRDAATLLGRTVSSVHRYVDLGQLSPALQADGLRGAKFFHRADVEALAAQLADRAASPPAA